MALEIAGAFAIGITTGLVIATALLESERRRSARANRKFMDALFGDGETT